MKEKTFRLKFIVILLMMSHLMLAQNVDIPQRSQRAKISQRLGLTWINIEYSSPSVGNGGKVFGTQIPYGQPWGAGDRENTTIAFEHDVLVEGKKIEAGKYGLYMVPDTDEFQIMLSKYSASWTQTYPTEDETVLKVSVKPQAHDFTEWLSYDFIDRGGKYVTAALKWENIIVPFKIEVAEPNEVLFESLKSELKGRGQFLWGANYDAANALNSRNIHLDKAMEWVQRSIDVASGFADADGRIGASLWLRAKLTIKKEGYSESAKADMHKAIMLITNPFDLNRAIYTLTQNGDSKKAIEGAKRLVSDHASHPLIWAFTDSLAETYLNDGNKKMALKYYKLAKSKAPSSQHEYFDGVIAKIEK